MCCSILLQFVACCQISDLNYTSVRWRLIGQSRANDQSVAAQGSVLQCAPACCCNLLLTKTTRKSGGVCIRTGCSGFVLQFVVAVCCIVLSQCVADWDYAEGWQCLHSWWLRGKCVAGWCFRVLQVGVFVCCSVVLQCVAHLDYAEVQWRLHSRSMPVLRGIAGRLRAWGKRARANENSARAGEERAHIGEERARSREESAREREESEHAREESTKQRCEKSQIQICVLIVIAEIE